MSRNDNTRKIGLARALSKLGYCSRSAAAELIHAGRVSLNGTIRRNPETPVAEASDRIEVDGKEVEARNKIYLMLNKARGVVTTASDERGRDTVYTLLNASSSHGTDQPREKLPWVAPVDVWTRPVRDCCS